MDLHSQGEKSHTRDANAEISEAVSHQQIMNYRQALERKLQQRTPREHLIDQGIMPAAATSTAPALLSQKTKLERAKTGDILQKKIRVRPDRDQLVQRHILNDTSTSVDPSLLANQIKLKRKKLEHDLNERLAVRPGPLELVKENILEQGTPVGLAVQEGNVSFTDTLNSSLLEPISPESIEGSPVPSPDNNLSSPFPPTTAADLLNKTNLQAALAKLPKSLEERPLEIQQGLRKERTRKKSPRQKFKKYKYHEYRPPNGEVQKSSLPMDSPYALMLQQQQLYLQLQVLYQNYPQFVSLPSIPENISKPINNNIDKEKPVKIEDMRVVDMRRELKIRGLPVSGSKTDLIERLKAAHKLEEQNAINSSDKLRNELSTGSPSIVTSIAPATCQSPIQVSTGVPVPISVHSKLGRSNSLPLHEARLQQVQSQLVANSKKLHTQLPPEVQQQLQHLQYLNLQTHLQQLQVQPQNRTVSPTSQLSPLQIASTGQPSQISPVKTEKIMTETCALSQQPKLSPVFNNMTTSCSTQPVFVTIHSNQTPQMTVTQAMPTINYSTSSNVQQPAQQGSSLQGSSLQGLMHLQAEANRLNIANSHSEPDLSLLEIDGKNTWNQVIGQQDTKIISPKHGSPRQTPVIFTSAPLQSQEYERVKTDQLKRSFSENSPEDGLFVHPGSQEKQRTLSEPPQPFGHRRSCSLPSGQLFLEHATPPPSYEAHMAAQLQRKLSQELPVYQQPGITVKTEDTTQPNKCSQDLTYEQQLLQQKQLQQQQILQKQLNQHGPQQPNSQQSIVNSKSEDMDINMEASQYRDLTQELQRAMMKQPDLGIDSDEILEILGASVGSSIASPDHGNSPHMMMNSHQSQYVSQQQQHISGMPRSPSTGFLSVFSPPQNNNHLPLQSRLSKSCEDMNSPYSKQTIHSINTENTLADIDSIIMSPASPMRIDTDNDDQLMSVSSNIPIPNGSIRPDPLGWLDLNSPGTLNTSPNSSTEVTYMNKNSPPPMLYGISSSLQNEALPLFGLDNPSQGSFSHDFTEAMDFCV